LELFYGLQQVKLYGNTENAVIEKELNTGPSNLSFTATVTDIKARSVAFDVSGKLINYVYFLIISM